MFRKPKARRSWLTVKETSLSNEDTGLSWIGKGGVGKDDSSLMVVWVFSGCVMR